MIPPPRWCLVLPLVSLLLFAFSCVPTTAQCSAGEFEAYTMCFPCPAGQREFNGVCIVCGRGKYQYEKGQTSCPICEKGFFSPLAPRRPWNPATNYPGYDSTRCTICPNGYHSTNNANPHIDCDVCVPGTHAVTELFTSVLGISFFLADETDVLPDPMPELERGIGMCRICPAGYYSTAPTITCTSCPKGYLNGDDATAPGEHLSCTECDVVGTYAASKVAVACSTCPVRACIVYCTGSYL